MAFSSRKKRTVQIKWKHVLLEIIKSIGLYVYVTVMNQSRVLGCLGIPMQMAF